MTSLCGKGGFFMQEQKRKWSISASALAAVLLMALAVGLLVLLAMGLLFSALVVRGTAGAGMLNGGAVAALFFASLLGGLFACRRLKMMPLVWGLCVGVLLVLVCLAAGALTYGAAAPGAVLARGAAALLGGGAAGVLSAMVRK